MSGQTASLQPKVSLKKQHFHRPACLAPPAPGEVRVFRTSTDYETVGFQNGDRMEDIYKKVRESSPDSVLILARLPDCREAVLAGDRAESCEVLVVTPKSLPLVLPAKFRVTVGEAREREVDFALLKHLLCDALGEFLGCPATADVDLCCCKDHKLHFFCEGVRDGQEQLRFDCSLKEDGVAQFYKTGLASSQVERSELVVLKAAAVRLDALVNHRSLVDCSGDLWGSVYSQRGRWRFKPLTSGFICGS